MLMTYRQGGNDFQPAIRCFDRNYNSQMNKCWDKHFKISRSDVEEFVRYNDIPFSGSDPTYDQTMIPESIRD